MEGRPLPGTERGTAPFWSPDSKSVAYFADGKLWRTQITGGVPTAVCDTGFSFGRGAWSRSGVILFAAGAGQGLYQVPAQGGTAKAVTTVDTSGLELTHRFPAFLPDGRRFLYSVISGSADSSGMYAASIDNPGQRTRVLPTSGTAVYAPPSGAHAAYLVWAQQQTVLAQKIDPESLRLAGEPSVILQNVGMTQTGETLFSVSENGIIASRQGGAKDLRISWHRDGQKELLPVPPGSYGFLRLAPAGRRVAFRRGNIGANWDLWTFDFSRSVMTRLTFDPGTESYPVWSPDSRHIVFAASRDGSSDLYRKEAAAGGADQRLTREPGVKAATDWSPDGRFILYRTTEPAGFELRTLDLQNGRTSPAFQSAKGISSARFSPDGKWIAYASNESGRVEVYVQAFGRAGGKWQVSNAGGNHPTWSADGSQIYFVTAPGLASVSVRASADGLEIGAIQHVVAYTPPSGLMYPYDSARDGKRFLVLDPVTEDPDIELVVISNWQSLLNR
jgi:Tol biopolymer transport system component